MAEQKDKVYNYIFNEILDKTLQLSENPSQFADYLTQQIREIVGARTIVIAIKNENQQTEIYSVFPERKKEWTNQPEVLQLAEISFGFDSIQFFDKLSNNKNVVGILQHLDIEKTIAIPLIASNIKVGAILLFDIMDLFGMNAVLDLLTRLSGIFALIIRNSVLYHNLEATVAIRTQELQKRNRELVERELELETANNKLNEHIAQIQNINAQLEESKQLSEEREAQTRSILKTAMDGFWMIDMKGKILDANEVACKMLGYSYNEMLKLHVHQIDALDTNEIISRRISQIIETGEARFETKHKCNTGQIIDVELSVKPHATQKILVAFIRDITAPKQAALELVKAKEKAEESDRLKTAFLQNMSHEIRTPMNAIMGFSELLLKNANDTTKLKKFTTIINQRCNDLLDIINDILDIAKIESGQLTINLEECNLHELFAELASFFTEYQKRIEKNHIEFRLHVDCDPFDNTIITDKVKLKQIFINLIGNAFKFTDQGKIEGGCKVDKNNNLLFYVSDTGIGIPLDKQEKVFERFAQLHQGSKKNIGGTGLGLSIVKGLVSLLDGKIILESEPQKGSTFSFTFPYKTPQNMQTEQSVVELPGIKNLSNKNILIVEDDFYNAEYLKEILSETDLTILHTEYGRQAVEIALSQPIDLVLMDIRLPDINGYEATRQIRQHKPQLKIIAQTAYAAQDEKQKAFDAGCDDYISKPTKQEVLLAMLHKHLPTE